jgi:DNA transposition AAA+ family ATPase
MARHFLELQDAATLETEHYLLTRRAVTDAVERCAMAVIHGNAGLGKTYTVNELVDEHDIEVLWTSFPSRPTPRQVAATLYEQRPPNTGLATPDFRQRLPTTNHGPAATRIGVSV